MTQGTPEPQDGGAAPQQGQQQPEPQQQGQTQQPTPPWEKEGQSFDPERAWNLIQSLRTDLGTIKTERDQFRTQATQLQQQSMSEQERAVTAARDEGRQAAIDELAPELARTQFDALAARRNKDFDTASALEFVDLKAFVVQGKPDVQKLQAAVDRLVPAPQSTPPAFDGGARRSGAGPTDMNTFIRQAAGHASG